MKAAIYCRLSEEDRNKQCKTDDSVSIQNQKSMLIQYCLEQGWEIYNIYSDDDYAGADRSRPKFNELLADAENRCFDIILCKTQSRFTRELELVEKYLHGLFPLWGIRFVSIVDNADTANKGNKKSRQINGLVNEWYLEDMSENIKSVLTSRRINGFHIGAFALYGYKKDPNAKGHLIVDEEAAMVVREVFQLFAQGYGKTAIARILNDRGIPNPTEYKRLHGLRYHTSHGTTSTLWKYAAISNMLVNQFYIGNMVQGRSGSVSYKTKQVKPIPKDRWIIVEDTHEPIISKELWDQVQAKIKARVKPLETGEIGIFARKVTCANCGYTMRTHKNRGYRYLQCSNRHYSSDACPGAFIPTRRLECIVLTELKRLTAEFLDQEECLRRVGFLSNLEIEVSRLEGTAAAYEKKISEYRRCLHDLYLDKVRGIVNDDEFLNLSKEFNAEKDRLVNLVSNGQKRITALKDRIAKGDNRRQLIARYTALETLNRATVEIMIDHIVVGRRIPGTKQYPVEIHWNF